MDQVSAYLKTAPFVRKDEDLSTRFACCQPLAIGAERHRSYCTFVLVKLDRLFE
jgi:hypothetical protein